MKITLEQLKKIFPKTKPEILATYVDPLNKTFVKFGFDNALSVRTFLAQIGHESGGFNFTKENLNYSADRLLVIFKKYFNAGNVHLYARKPDKIANRVYANRMGNNNEESGDGWKYRGRGLIQITGFNNYSALSKYLKMNMDQLLTYLETPEGATISAGWFFLENNLIALAKAGAVTETTKKINGGTNGLEDRLDIFNRSKTIIV